MNLSRETRLNLIVLAVLAVLLAPGAVILVRKQLSSSTRIEFLRDPVRVEAAYLDPVDLPSHIRRIVPTPVTAWLRTLPDTSATPALTLTWRQGLVSLRRKFEIVTVAPLSPASSPGSPPGSCRITLAAWDPAMTRAAANVAFNCEKGAITLLSTRTVDIPDPVRESLKNAGWTTPPHQLGWFELELRERVPDITTTQPLADLTLEAEYETPDGRLVEPITIPNHPDR
ncbi:MAG: hypothetical protein IT442_03190 [Phycisphaeraceae bacterium]|nr:hypothetical protein [Phycisphaeraceae bacterium]